MERTLSISRSVSDIPFPLWGNVFFSLDLLGGMDERETLLDFGVISSIFCWLSHVGSDLVSSMLFSTLPRSNRFSFFLDFPLLLPPSSSWKWKIDVEECAPPPYQCLHVVAFAVGFDVVSVVALVVFVEAVASFVVLYCCFSSCCYSTFCWWYCSSFFSSSYCCYCYFVAFPTDAVFDTDSPTLVTSGVCCGASCCKRGLAVFGPLLTTSFQTPGQSGPCQTFPLLLLLLLLGEVVAPCSYQDTSQTVIRSTAFLQHRLPFFPAHHYVGYFYEVFACHWYLVNKFPCSNARFTYNFRDVLNISISDKKKKNPILSSLISTSTCLSGAHVFSL